MTITKRIQRKLALERRLIPRLSQKKIEHRSHAVEAGRQGVRQFGILHELGQWHARKMTVHS